MLEAGGLRRYQARTALQAALALGIHEMGTAHMGKDPTKSVLNKYNQAHDVPNLFVTDGACMASGGCQNPSLTYMAMSARGAHHATRVPARRRDLARRNAHCLMCQRKSSRRSRDESAVAAEDR